MMCTEVARAPFEQIEWAEARRQALPVLRLACHNAPLLLCANELSWRSSLLDPFPFLIEVAEIHLLLVGGGGAERRYHKRERLQRGRTSCYKALRCLQLTLKAI